MKRIFEVLGKRVDLFILLLCLGLSYGVWQMGVRGDQTDVTSLEQAVNTVEDDLNNEIGHIFHYVNGVVGLYESADEIGEQDLSNFMKVMSRNDDHPTLLRIGFVKAISVDDSLQMLVSQVVDQHGKIYPASLRDLMIDENVKDWIANMMSDGIPRVEYSQKILNVEEYDGDGFVFSEPIYRDGKFVGIINAVVSGQAVKAKIDEGLKSGMEWDWQMGEALMLKEKVVMGGRVLSKQIIVSLTPGTSWKVRVFVRQLPSQYWNGILAIGFAISFIVYVAVYGLSSANSRAEIIASKMTVDLKKYKLALDSASNHIIISDADGVVVYANKSAQNLTGFSESEIIGQTPRLWGGQMSKEFYDLFWDEIKVKKHVFIGTLTNKRKNGELYTAQATVSPIISDTGELIGFVGVEEDVTIEIKNLKEREETLDKLAKFNELMLGREMKMVELKEALRKAQEENAKT